MSPGAQEDGLDDSEVILLNLPEAPAGAKVIPATIWAVPASSPGLHVGLSPVPAHPAVVPAIFFCRSR
jgi:hypothetical protein